MFFKNVLSIHFIDRLQFNMNKLTCVTDVSKVHLKCVNPNCVGAIMRRSSYLEVT